MQLAVSDNDSRIQSIRDRVANATACLKLLDEPDQRGVLNTVVMAIQNVMIAAYSGERIGQIAPETARELEQLLTAATPIVLRATAGKMLAERIYFQMGAVKGLLTPHEDPYRLDRLDYAGLLAAELARIHHSQSLAAREYPLLRLVRMEQAWATPRDPDARLQ